MQDSVRVAVNTAVQYVKMAITVVVALISTRIILGALGESDYGIFSLVAGVIAMLTFLNAALAVSVQRYLSYHIGKGDTQEVSKVFNVGVLMHFLLAIILVVLVEVSGLILFEHVLNIPAGRLEAAKTVFHFMVFASFVTIISSSFDALIVAHEHLLMMSVVDILVALLKLVGAICLLYISHEKLVVYGFLMSLIVLVSFMIKFVWCKLVYRHQKLDLIQSLDRKLFRELAGFGGWNAFGSFCTIGRVQGCAIIINSFYGVVVIAAFGIANMVNAQLYFFSESLLRAFNPQIVKSEGASDRNKMLRLSKLAAKLSFYLMAMASLPVMIEMPLLLRSWLGEVPEGTILFCRLTIIITLIRQLSSGIVAALQAIGEIKYYQIFVGTLLLLVLPCGWFVLYLGFQPYSILVVALVLEVIAFFIRLQLLGFYASFSKWEYASSLLLRVVIPVSLSAVVSILPLHVMGESIFRLFIVMSVSVPVSGLLMYNLGLSSDEKDRFVGMVRSVVAVARCKLLWLK